MSDHERSRRALMRSAAVGASGLALGSVASTASASGVACDGQTETTTRSGSLSGADDAASVTYDAVTNDPCELVFDLSSADATDFDLYVTFDGRTPSTTDYDAKSKTALSSGESITVAEGNVDAGANFGVLVDSYTAGGSWTLETTETSASDDGDDDRPDASFTASATTVTVGDSVDFDASASTGGAAPVPDYEWAFGDGTTATGSTVSHAYDATDEFTVTLTVTNENGGTGTASETITVESSGGDCGVTKTRTETGTLIGDGDSTEYAYSARTADPCEVTLDLSADDGTDFDLYVTYDGRPPTISDYDDRAYNYGSDESLTVDGSNFDAADSLGVLVDSYSGNGDFTLVMEEVGTGDGGGSPDPNDPPTATFDASSGTVTVGETVQFDATASSDADGSVVGYEWTFGDGATASSSTTSHEYASAGAFEVTIAVTDDDGASATASRTITVEDDSGDDCGTVSETASADGNFWWFGGGDTYTYETRTAEPCRVTVDLDGPSTSDFDLYLTTDGRTPTTSDYDARSAGSGGNESVTLDDADVPAGADVGILVEPASGSGSYTLEVEELGR